MKLIVGIGNPELRFADTRHNTGFALVDSYAADKGVVFKHSVKFKADIAELSSGDEKVLLVKPTTYYNLVGESVRAICDFYKLQADDVLVIHDELALPFGTIRTRQGGSDAGNNGVKSLNQHVGATTQRLRIGIWNNLRDKMNDADFVLAKFTPTERKQFTTIATTASSHVDDFVSGKLTQHTLRVEM